MSQAPLLPSSDKSSTLPQQSQQQHNELVTRIGELKKKHNAIVLAHYYQPPEIQDIADFLGDSLQLARQAVSTNARVICFAGVHFMAETAKILNPTRTVVVPDLTADCSMAQSCPADQFRLWREKYPNAVVVSYVNCSAEVKALSDWICTSSNAIDIVSQIDPKKRVLFGPDQNLGRYIQQKTGRDMLLWQGACHVHKRFSAPAIRELKTKHPNAAFIAHPECCAEVLALADFIGSTKALLSYVQSCDRTEFIIGTEPGILHQMNQLATGKIFMLAPSNTKEPNICEYMKLTTLQKVHDCLLTLQPEIVLSQRLINQALVPIERMLSVS